MKRKIFIAIIAALAAMCVLAVSVGAYGWSTKNLYVIVDREVIYKEETDIFKFLTPTYNDKGSLTKFSAGHDTSKYTFEGWIDSYHGTDKILMATDCPWGSIPKIEAFLAGTDLTQDELFQIRYGNAKRLLGI